MITDKMREMVRQGTSKPAIAESLLNEVEFLERKLTAERTAHAATAKALEAVTDWIRGFIAEQPAARMHGDWWAEKWSDFAKEAAELLAAADAKEGEG